MDTKINDTIRVASAPEAHPALVSVIVPVYNDATGLRECLRALQAQTYDGKVEIIVVDDGSTDDSAAVASSFGVQLIRRPQGGPARARNAGVRAARGEIVVFTDADCAPSPDWLAAMVAPFADPRTAGSRGLYRSRQRSLTARFAQLEFEEKYRHLKRAPTVDFVDTSAAAYRRDIFQSTGGFATDFPAASGEDTDLSFRLAEAGHRLVLCPDAYVYHRHPEHLGAYVKRKINRAMWRPQIYRRHPAKMATDSHTPQTLKLHIILAALLVASIVLWPLTPIGAVVAAVTATAFLVSTIPFVVLSFRQDRTVALLAPAYLLVRALAFVAGLIPGCLRVLASAAHTSGTRTPPRTGVGTC